METDPLYENTTEGYLFRSPTNLSVQQRQEIIQVLFETPSKRSGPLSGRTGPSFGEVHGIGQVAAKHYRRGGTFRWYFPSLFLRKRVSRSEHEMQVMVTASRLGIPTPEPVASITSGKFICKTWLITKKIPQHCSLAEFASRSPDRLAAVMEKACTYLKKCIDEGIFHIDLHPGNIIVLGDESVVFLDFDKATIERRSKAYLRDQYIFRWRRAVIKHILPHELTELFCAHLKQTW